MRQAREKMFRTVTVNMAQRNVRTMMVTMSVGLAALFVFLGVVSIQLLIPSDSRRVSSQIVQSMSTASLSSIMAQEIPQYASASSQVPTPAGKTSVNLLDTLIYVFTDIDPGNPLSLVGNQIPGMAVSLDPLTKGFDPSNDDVQPANMNTTQPTTLPTDTPPSVVSSDGKPFVYIYHTHNRESFLPELPGVKDASLAYDSKVNITMVGTRISQQLEKQKIGVIHTTNDYWVPGRYAESYDFSRKTVEEILKKNKSIKMVFDIHRDSDPRSKTTINVNGQSTAKVSFIIGGSNPNWKKNSDFAIQIHNLMEKMYPGVSRGVGKKTLLHDDSRYNQDLAPQDVLIEIGGPENTMEEEYRAADMVANVIAILAKQEISQATTTKSP